MERQLVVSISEVTGFEYTCPTKTCGARFVRTLKELTAWYHKADPTLGQACEALCSFCEKRETEKHRDIRDLIGNVHDVWTSDRSAEIKLRVIISAEHRIEKEGNA